MACLIQISGDQRGSYFVLGRRTNVVGRAEALPIHILDSLVSRKHMQVRFDAKTYEYKAIDMNSRHGVFINGHKINEEVVLNNRDIIQIGRTNLLFTKHDLGKGKNILHRFKKVGEAVRRTHTTFFVKKCLIVSPQSTCDPLFSV